MLQSATMFDFDVEAIAKKAIDAAWRAWDASATEFKWPVHSRPNFIYGFVSSSVRVHLYRRALAVKRGLN